MLFRFIFCCLFIPHVLFSEIIEICSINEILPHVSEGTLFVFDIDETLLTTKQILGGDVWFQKKRQKYLDEGYSAAEALAKVLPAYMNLQIQTAVEPVEGISPFIIHKLQKQNNKVIGLTARNTELAFTTVAQLRSIGIDFNNNPIIVKGLDISTHFPLRYVEGILFAEGRHKGDLLIELIGHSEYPLERVVFVDDKLKYLKQMQEVCLANNISFVGLRYGASDTKIETYDEEIADLQLKYFGRILSNEAAEVLIASKGSIE